MRKVFDKSISVEGTGENLHQLRKSLGLRVVEVQRFLGLSSVQAVYRWEHGNCLPAYEHLLGLSALYNCSIGVIFRRS